MDTSHAEEVVSTSATGNNDGPFELAITNAGVFTKGTHVSRALTEAGIKHLDVDKKKGTSSAAAFVTFASEADRAAAMLAIPSIRFKGKNWSVKEVTVNSARGSSARKRARFEAERSASEPAAAASSATTTAATDGGAGAGVGNVHDATSPWHAVPYAEQLQRKQREMALTLVRMSQYMADFAAIQGKGGVEAVKEKYKRDEKAQRRQIEAQQRLAAQQRQQQQQAGATPDAGAGGTGGVAGKKRAAPEGGHVSEGEGDGSGGDSEGEGEGEGAAAAAAEAFVRTTVKLPRQPDAVALLPQWLQAVGASGDSKCCTLAPILPAPLTHGYRNKAQFTIGLDAAGVPTAGFRLSRFEGGTTVASPEGSVHLSPSILAVVDAANAFLRSSPLPVYDQRLHKGVWRQLTVRYVSGSLARPAATGGSGCDATGVTLLGGKLVVDMMVKPPETPATPAATAAAAPAAAAAADAGAAAAPAATASAAEVYEAELKRFVAAMQAVTAPGGVAAADGAAVAPATVSSVYVQEYSGPSQPDPNAPRMLKAGEATVVEHMCGMSFEISPGSFFQVNTPAAERLYYLVRAMAVDGVAGGAASLGLPLADLATAASSSSSSGSSSGSSGSSGGVNFQVVQPSPRPDVAVLDVCCGTGTIGLTCADRVKRVVGVELSSDAIADAQRNAARNHADNTTFLCAKAEDVMRQIIPIAQGTAPATTTASASAAATAASTAAATPADASAAAATASAAATPAAATSSKPPPAAPVYDVSQVVAIVDPPRGGLHPSVIGALRTCKPLKRIVYVSCAPTGSLVEDMLKLCAPSVEGRSAAWARGPAFTPRLAVPVDLFPHTPHCEMVMLFERE